jgi:NAD-dependent dihydropyrimidine dehydrogenase PreA subunit
MIELVLAERCTGCDRCVTVCPTNVFDAVANAPPVIARKQDCQTCFMCELYCQADALYVDPNADRPVTADPAGILASGLLGQYRRDSGWDEWEAQYPNEQWMMELVFRRAATGR